MRQREREEFTFAYINNYHSLPKKQEKAGDVKRREGVEVRKNLKRDKEGRGGNKAEEGNQKG